MTQLTEKITKAMLPAAAALVAIATLGGCTSNMPGQPAEQFMEPGELSHVTRMADQQTAIGSRTDATLRPYHFNAAGGLNSLGREKLDQMIDADDTDGAAELVVYVDTKAPAENDAAGKKLASARQDAVTQFLISRGLTEQQFRLESGFNPESTFAASSARPVEDPNAASKAMGEGLGKGYAQGMSSGK